MRQEKTRDYKKTSWKRPNSGPRRIKISRFVSCAYRGSLGPLLLVRGVKRVGYLWSMKDYCRRYKMYRRRRSGVAHFMRKPPPFFLER